jgi:hypothetical protein
MIQHSQSSDLLVSLMHTVLQSMKHRHLEFWENIPGSGKLAHEA